MRGSSADIAAPPSAVVAMRAIQARRVSGLKLIVLLSGLVWWVIFDAVVARLCYPTKLIPFGDRVQV
jgi:hypothetical protein